MKTADLQGALLDYYVAKAEGEDPVMMGSVVLSSKTTDGGNQWNHGPLVLGYSTNWTQCGPLIEKYKLNIESPDYAHTPWVVSIYSSKRHAYMYGYGTSPLQAICRAVVRAAFGDEVEEVLP